MYKRDIYLDIDDELNNYIKSVELDSNSRVWHFHLTVDYEPLDLTGKSVQFRAEKPDKTNVLNDCKIVDAEKGVVEVKLTRQVNAIPGHVKCLLKIIGDEGFVLKTKTFVVDVSKTLSDDTIVSSDEFGALEAALGKVQDIDNRFAQTNAQLSQTEKKLNTKISNLDKRKFKKKVCAGVYIIKSSKNETILTKEEITERLDIFYNQGYDGIILFAHIEPTNTSISNGVLDYRILETIENIKFLADEAFKKGMSVSSIKVHQLYAQQNWDEIDKSQFFEVYKELCIQLCETFRGYNIPHFVLLNEAWSIVSDSTVESDIIDLLDSVKSYGYTVGLSGHTIMSDNIANHVDCIYPHSYPTITNKEGFATYDDGISGWLSSGEVERFKNIREKFPTKRIVMAETGVQNHFKALALPERYIWDNITWESKGKPQSIFYKGLFDVMKDVDFEEVWILLLYEEGELILNKKLFYEYLRGEIIG